MEHRLKEDTVVQNSYIASSRNFKDHLLPAMPFPANFLLFTTDAESYYTSINTTQALRKIGNYLCANERRFKGIPVNALMAGLQLVMSDVHGI